MPREGRKHGVYRPHIDKDGYQVIPATAGQGSRIRGNAILEHRAVAEKMLGRKLRSDEVVHHLNHDKLDNRPENLQVMSRAEHVKAHAHYEKVCVICSKAFIAKNGRAKFCCTQCANHGYYLSRASKGYFQARRQAEKLSEERRCKACSALLGLAHRNRDYCSSECDPWH